ncbi:LPXTG cell wall anchor domain-containing protein [Corynebacterium xerosis]|uniref:LPXTG cell wall anchor domain-containing protein n=1 Tax=Corynebacterium xerosis TaxID=1725 RepID=A0A6B8TGP9_9CORY|nr:LPXTG cell wall anchor domain-containing protein [Corynebacterium xerosis]QGS35228.1 LPXTG cell wall anchor domain-containing protein [Corynebacterium xerosis]
MPARTGDNDAAWAAAGGVVLISVAGGVYARRRRASQ